MRDRRSPDRSSGWVKNQMRRVVWGILVAAVLLPTGCTLRDENPDWSPGADYPPWAFDAPVYYRPTEELPVAETLEGGIEVYYTPRDFFFIRHPDGYQLDGEPRVAVWLSTDRGGHWRRAGYFGVEQTHFLLRGEGDGPHWIRFVGPGQGTPDVLPARPRRIYTVDRQPPKTTIRVSPAPWKDEDRTAPRRYEVGQVVTVSWDVSDANLRPGSVRIGMAKADAMGAVVWRWFNEPLPPVGTLRAPVPIEAARDGTMRFHLTAEDQAGNVGMAVTDVMHITAPTAVAQPAEGAPEPSSPRQPHTAPPSGQVPSNPSPSQPPNEPGSPIPSRSPGPAPPGPDAATPAGPGARSAVKAPRRDGVPGASRETDGTWLGLTSAPQLAVWEEGPGAGEDRARTADGRAILPILGRFETLDRRPPARLDWPQRGGLLRGRTLRVLRWMPARAARHDAVDLLFSATDGRTWWTLAEGVEPGRPIHWFVPPVSSRHCRLKLAARDERGRSIPLAVSEPFQVHTPGADEWPAPDEE